IGGEGSRLSLVPSLVSPHRRATTSGQLVNTETLKVNAHCVTCKQYLQIYGIERSFDNMRGNDFTLWHSHSTYGYKPRNILTQGQ
ncbi:hypothetical protein J6590_095442, partial [Homalodisca vitripennis]